jgi:chorismate-pyruvate lyase
VLQRRLHCELTFQDLGVDHGDNRLAKVTADLKQLLGLKLLRLLCRLALLGHQVLVLGVTHCVESRLEGVRVDDVELAKHHETSCRFFVFFVGKLAVIEAK